MIVWGKGKFEEPTSTWLKDASGWVPDPAAPTTRPLGYKIIGGTEKQYRNWVVKARKWIVKNDAKDAKTNRSGAKRKRAAPKETNYCDMANGLADMLQDEKEGRATDRRLHADKVQELETTITEVTQQDQAKKRKIDDLENKLFLAENSSRADAQNTHFALRRLGEEEAKLQAEKTAHEATRAELRAAEKTTTNTTTSNTSGNDSYNSDYEESPQNDSLAQAEDAFRQWQRVDRGSVSG
jgi:hypothetical protein